MYRLLLISLLTLVTCSIYSQELTQGKSTINQNNFYTEIQQHFHIIDSLRRVNFDLMEDENLKLQETIKNYKEDIFNLNDTLDFDWLYITKSADSKFCLVTWDTRMGGTMIDFATMTIFKKRNGELVSKLLIDTSNSEITMHYDTIYIVSTSQNIYYLAQGFGQGSTALPWQEIRAFQIKKDELLTPTIFPENKANLFAEFDTHQFNEQERIPTIKIKENGKIILVPKATEQEGFSGKYETFVLEGEIYKAK